MKKTLFSVACAIFLFLAGVRLIMMCADTFGKSEKVAGTDKIDTTKLAAPVIAYHIKVECYGKTGYYCIKFTNDNWETVEKAMKIYDLSGWAKSVDVTYDEYVESQSKCLLLAKKLKTYEKAKRYNTITYRDYVRLLNYRTDHPSPMQPKLKEIEDCCKEINIY